MSYYKVVRLTQLCPSSNVIILSGAFVYTGPNRLIYSTDGWTWAKKPARELGFGIAVFDSLPYARGFARDEDKWSYDRELLQVWRVHARNPHRPTEDRMMSGVIQLNEIGKEEMMRHFREARGYCWPARTMMCDAIKLIERMEN